MSTTSIKPSSYAVNDDQKLYAALIVINLFNLGTLFLLWKYRHLDFFQRRLSSVLYLSSAANILAMNLFLLGMDIPNFFFYSQCWVQWLCFHLIMPFWIYAQLVRSAHLIFSSAINQARLAMKRRESGARDQKNATDHGPPLWLVKSVHRFFVVFDWSSNKILKEKGNAEDQSLSNFRALKGGSILRAMLSFEIFVLTGMAIYYFSASSVFTTNALDTLSCGFMIYIWLYTVIGVSFIIIPYAIFAMRNVNDSLGIRIELTIVLSLSLPCFVLYLSTIVLQLPILFNLGVNFYPAVGCFVDQCLLVFWPLYLTHLESRQKRNLNLDQASFERVLGDYELFAEFKQVVAKEFCLENVLFVEDYWRLLDVAGIPRLGMTGEQLNKLEIKENTVAAHLTTVAGSSLKSQSHSSTIIQPPLPSLKNPSTKKNISVFAVHQLSRTIPESEYETGSESGKAALTRESILSELLPTLFNTYIAKGSLYELNLPDKLLDPIVKMMNSTPHEIKIEHFEPVYQAVLYMLFSNSYARFVIARQRNKSNV